MLLLNHLVAPSAELRLNSKTLPWNSLVPDGVISLTCEEPPAASAPCVLVVIVNSPIVSEVGRLGTKSSPLVRMKLS